jgi:predicted CoA-substrate-specific enzyme activase
MAVAGIDVGGQNVHVVILSRGKIIAKARLATGISKAQAAEKAFDDALRQSQLTRQDIERTVATGSSGKRVAFASSVTTDAAADARGINKVIPSARTVIDVGGEESRAIKVSDKGRVLDFAVNERCAAGSGTFIDTISRTLEVPVEGMSELARQSQRSIPMNSQCAVFGESEVISMIHQKISKSDIARAVHDAIANRLGSLVRNVGLEEDIVMVGGVALNQGFVESLSRALGKNIKVPDDPDYIGALGAALAAEGEAPGKDAKTNGR